jgi:hypothetical protein
MQFGANPGLTTYVTKLMHLRQGLEPLRRGKQLEMWQDDQVYGYTRLEGGSEAMTFLNNDDQAQTRDIPLRAESQLPDGTVLTDMLNGGTVTVANRHLHVTLGAKQARIFAVQGNRKQSPRRR